MPKKTLKPQNRKTSLMRSSPAARRLIKAYIKRYGCEREAAKHLHMTQGQLNGIKTGRLHDTAAMKIALKRADSRARRAWLMVDRDEPRQMIDDHETLRAVRRAMGQADYMIGVILREGVK